jgi:hypothetical protein
MMMKMLMKSHTMMKMSTKSHTMTKKVKDVDAEMDDSEVDGEKEVDKDDATSSKKEIILKPAPPDEYADHDTSDEEDIRNTVGNIPKNWYDEYKHFGYDWDGNQIIKPETGDHLGQLPKTHGRPRLLADGQRPPNRSKTWFSPTKTSN